MGSLDVRSDRVDPLVGSMLGKDYRVIEPIGLGGMAVVYLVEHQTLRKRFAAKVLSVELAANLEARARFNQEAHAASQLDHENIVNISDFGATADQRPFFVMELLRGQTLDQRVAEAAMSIEEVVAVAVPVARALAHAHAEGIIHRDVKPENVFLVQRSQGRFGVKVVDFGIAKTPVNTRLTKMGETLGSPMFMSPEACRGDDVDHRADLYSFGVLLYLMLCGRVPFEDENLLKVLQMQVSSPLPPPRSVNPDVSPELAAVIERALAKDRDARYESMDALLADLEAAVPAGADRLLIEAQAGGASSFRMTTLSGQGGPRVDSQRLSSVSSQPMPAYAGKPHSATSAGTLTAVPPRKRRWMIALPLVGMAAVGAWLVTRKGDAAPPPSAPPPAIAAASEPATPQPAATVAPAEPPQPIHPDKPDSKPAPDSKPDEKPAPTPDGKPDSNIELTPATVHLRLTTTPAGATVALDGKQLGATPLDIDVARLDGEADLVIARDGFTERKQRVDLRADQSLSLTLEPIARPVRTIRRPPPPRREVRAPASAPAAGSAASTPGRNGGSAGSAAPKGDPSLDIRLSR